MTPTHEIGRRYESYTEGGKTNLREKCGGSNFDGRHGGTKGDTASDKARRRTSNKLSPGFETVELVAHEGKRTRVVSFGNGRGNAAARQQQGEAPAKQGRRGAQLEELHDDVAKRLLNNRRE